MFLKVDEVIAGTFCKEHKMVEIVFMWKYHIVMHRDVVSKMIDKYEAARIIIDGAVV
jgi:hypothetical protein